AYREPGDSTSRRAALAFGRSARPERKPCKKRSVVSRLDATTGGEVINQDVAAVVSRRGLVVADKGDGGNHFAVPGQSVDDLGVRKGSGLGEEEWAATYKCQNRQ